MAKFEEQDNDTLRSMELALVRVYREDESVMDWQVETAVNNLIRIFTAEQRKRKPPTLKMPPETQQAFTNLQIACEGWLGRGPLPYSTKPAKSFNSIKTRCKLPKSSPVRYHLE